MSTRAAIGMRVGDHIHTIYSHYDGYPEHVGKILQEHFRSADAAKKLIYGRHIQHFTVSGFVERYEDGHYDISDTPCKAIEGYDYLYLFDPAGNEWVCFGRSYDLPARALKRIDIPA